MRETRTSRETKGPETEPSQAVVWNRPRIVAGYARALTKIVQLDIRRYAPLVNRDTLFQKRWRTVGSKPTRAARLEAEQTLDRLFTTGCRYRLWHGTLVYGLFAARIQGRELLVLHSGTSQELARLEFAPAFARRLSRRHRSASFPVAFQVVTLGPRAVEDARKLAKQGQANDQFLLDGLSAELTEALAEYGQFRLPKLPGWSKNARYSPGDPVWPDLSEQRKVFTLLRPERIGVTLTKTFQLVPECSASAIILPA
jgi:5-methyltetrahydrofolate--homocysteine methyltransferase